LPDLRGASVLADASVRPGLYPDGLPRRADRDYASDHIFVGEKGDYYEITDGLPQTADH
jgi:hypothetical protein